jgi:hypothetical protein
MQNFAVLIMTICAWTLTLRPANAQTNSEIGRAHASLAPVRQYVAAEAAPARLILPPNFIVPDDFRSTVESMLRGSPTFRRQCLRIAGEPTLKIVLVFRPPPWRSDVRATTAITRQPDGRKLARITIPPRHDVVELIAHEFEHIIEQLDGVDLAARASRPNTGVRAQMREQQMFETVRATRMGRKVAREVRRLP